MAAWRVGMRVRVVRCLVGHIPHQYIGAEGFIRDIGPYPGFLGHGAFDCHVPLAPGYTLCALFGELEPIQPERNQVVAWSECGFHPSDFLKERVA